VLLLFDEEKNCETERERVRETFENLNTFVIDLLCVAEWTDVGSRKRKGKNKNTFEDDLAMAMEQSLQMEREREELFAALALGSEEKRDLLFPSLPATDTTPQLLAEEEGKEEAEVHRVGGEQKAATVWVSAAERLKQNLLRQNASRTQSLPSSDPPSSDPYASSASSSSSSSSPSSSSSLVFSGVPIVLGPLWLPNPSLPPFSFGFDETHLFTPLPTASPPQIIYFHPDFEDLSCLRAIASIADT
jgi:hypothetical protein